MRPLVILRPEPAASRSADHARAMGLTVRILPLFELVPLPWSAPDPAGFDALVFTSANAIRLGGDELAKLRSLPVHAVGAATAAAARAAGLTVVSVGEGGVRNIDLPASDRLLHLAGRDHFPVGATMTINIYEARAIEHPAGFDQLQHCVVAVHSPRAGRRLAELARHRSSIAVAAISPAAAEACAAGWQCVHAAPQPTDEALLALAASLCERPAP